MGRTLEPSSNNGSNPMHEREMELVRRLRHETIMRAADAEHSLLAQFHQVARAIALHGDNEKAIRSQIQRECGLPTATKFVEKAGATTSDEWTTGPGWDMARAFIQDLSQESVFDLIGEYGGQIPGPINSAMLASGATADITGEAGLKVVRKMEFTEADMQPVKATAMVVVTEELLRASGQAAARMVEAELRRVTLEAMNGAVLSALTTTQPVTPTGNGAVADLTAGLAAAELSRGYVVAASAEIVRDLAIASDGRMGINGGQFIPGVWVVRVDVDSGTSPMRIVPASKIRTKDYGMRLLPARHATVNMADSPTSPSNQVSLFQTNSRALLFERMFAVTDTATVVEVG